MTTASPERRRRRGMTPGDLVLGILPLSLGTLSSIATVGSRDTWYRRLDRPAWTPPDRAFGPVWTTLYMLMGAALVLLRRDRAAPEQQRTSAIRWFRAQLLLNLAWTPLFFGARRIRLAGVELVVLWVAIVATIRSAFRVRPLAAALLLPYLAWSTLATALNLEIWRRNA